MMPVRIAAAGLLTALAVTAALLAGDVRAWRDALRGGDAVYAVSPARASWAPATRLGGTASTLLGVGNDVAVRRALRLYRMSRAVPADRLDTAVAAQTARADAENALAGVARSNDAATASRALTLLGMLAFGGPAAGTGPSQATTALSDFTEAAKLDPQNRDAKFDLELLLRLTAPHNARAGAGRSTSVGAHGRRGAGGGFPGSGY